MSARIAKGRWCRVLDHVLMKCKFYKQKSYADYPVCTHEEAKQDQGWLVKCPREGGDNGK